MVHTYCKTCVAMVTGKTPTGASCHRNIILQYMNRILSKIIITTEIRSCITIYSFCATIAPQATVIGITFKVIHCELLNTMLRRVTKQNIKENSKTILEVSISFLNTSTKVQASGPQIFQNSRIHLKILSTRRLTRSTFHTKDAQIICSTTSN
jgi:hypothetical protein